MLLLVISKVEGVDAAEAEETRLRVGIIRVCAVVSVCSLERLGRVAARK